MGMRINGEWEAILVTLLFLSAVTLWTIPIRNDPSPYGEVDASSHYAVADYTIRSGSSITALPFYIDKRYGKDNDFKQHVLWYPPPIHTTYAIGGILSGDPARGIYVTNALLTLLILISVYLLIRKLYGIPAAFLSSFLLMFSLRDIMIYLWGQWPERIGFAFLPLILYCLYEYSEKDGQGRHKAHYLYLMALLLAANFFIHPMTFFHSVLAIFFAGLFFLAKEKKLFFSWKHAGIAVLLFLLVLSIFPYQTLNVVVKSEKQKGLQSDKGDFSRLFSWFKPQKDNQGVPAAYFSYKEMIGPLWTVPFVLLGIVFLLLRRSKKDLLMLAWLVSLYIMIHLDIIGKGRVHRSLSGTAHLFYPLMILGLFFLVSIIPYLRNYQKALKPALGILFVALLFPAIGISAYNSLKGAYPGISRVNPYQLELAGWLRESGNIPLDAELYHMGSLSLAKTRWLWMVGHRYIIERESDITNVSFMIIDYSDFSQMGNQQLVNQLKNFENEKFANRTAIYKNPFIKVYPVASGASP